MHKQILFDREIHEIFFYHESHEKHEKGLQEVALYRLVPLSMMCGLACLLLGWAAGEHRGRGYRLQEGNPRKTVRIKG